MYEIDVFIPGWPPPVCSPERS